MENLKVLVIDDSPGRYISTKVPPFSFGDIIFVQILSEEETYKIFSHLNCCLDYKKISELNYFYQDTFWDRKRFVIISDIDESNIERNYNLGQVEVFNRILPRFKAKNG